MSRTSIRLEEALRRNEVVVSAVLFVLALAPRVWVAANLASEPVWDGHYYHFGAERIAGGFGYSDERVTPQGIEWHPWCHYPVGYSAFLAMVYRVFGASVTSATLANAVVGALTVLVVHRLALAWMSPIRALLAGLVTALHPGLVLYTALIMTEPLAGLGLVAAPLAYARVAGVSFRSRIGGALSAGLVLGLTTLVRPQSLLSAPLIGLLALRNSSWKRALVVGALATASCVAVVLPWTARNCSVMDGCAFVSTNGGWNLAIGSSPHATGRFDTISGEDGCRDVSGQVQQDRCWFDKGLTWIRDDPSRWLSLVPRKLAYTFDHQSFAVGYLAQAEPEAWPEAQRARDRTILTVFQYALLGAAALGVLRVPRRAFPTGRAARLAAARDWLLLLVVLAVFVWGAVSETPTVWRVAVIASVIGAARLFGRDRGASALVIYLALTLGGLVVVHAVFFGEDRYQIVVTPALALLAAAALARPRGEVASSTEARAGEAMLDDRAPSETTSGP